MEYQPPTPPPPPEPPVPGKTGMGLDQNVAAALSYVCCWLTGLIFYLLEKENKFVRFHAMQSIIAFGALYIIQLCLWIVSFLPPHFLFAMIALIGQVVVGIVMFITFLACIIKAYQGERFHLPVVGEMAEKYAQ